MWRRRLLLTLSRRHSPAEAPLAPAFAGRKAAGAHPAPPCRRWGRPQLQRSSSAEALRPAGPEPTAAGARRAAGHLCRQPLLRRRSLQAELESTGAVPTAARARWTARRRGQWRPSAGCRSLAVGLLLAAAGNRTAELRWAALCSPWPQPLRCRLRCWEVSYFHWLPGPRQLQGLWPRALPARASPPRKPGFWVLGPLAAALPAAPQALPHELSSTANATSLAGPVRAWGAAGARAG
mmetsp:Transcript_78504/g.217046  ORF Transcript_78504/g.217046 Transcript_78504/m.217046 type:complete len:237 (-) Transcript_78504:446-1156(-)